MLFSVFDEKFENVPLYGREYFQGKLNEMIDTICSLRNFTCSNDSSLTEFHKQLTHQKENMKTY